MRKKKKILIDFIVYPTYEIRYYNDGDVEVRPNLISFPLFYPDGTLLRPMVVE